MNDHLEGQTDYYRSEHRLRTKSGEWLWVLARGKVVSRDAEVIRCGRPARIWTSLNEKTWSGIPCQRRALPPAIYYGPGWHHPDQPGPDQPPGQPGGFEDARIGRENSRGIRLDQVIDSIDPDYQFFVEEIKRNNSLRGEITFIGLMAPNSRRKSVPPSIVIGMVISGRVSFCVIFRSARSHKRRYWIASNCSAQPLRMLQLRSA